MNGFITHPHSFLRSYRECGSEKTVFLSNANKKQVLTVVFQPHCQYGLNGRHGANAVLHAAEGFSIGNVTVQVMVVLVLPLGVVCAT